MTYHLIAYSGGQVVGAMNTEDIKEAKRFYSQSFTNRVCVRLFVDGIKIRIPEADNLMGYYTEEWSRRSRQKSGGAGAKPSVQRTLFVSTQSRDFMPSCRRAQLDNLEYKNLEKYAAERSHTYAKRGA